jgi:acetoin utilization protein AcuB
MLVRDYMTRHPVMVEPEMSIVEAQGIMAEAKVRHLPVIESGKRLVGLVTRERMRIPPTELASLNVWEITRLLSNLTIKDVMAKREQVVTVEPDAPLEKAAQIMVENKVGCLPVLEEGVVVGIITETDLLALLMEMMATRVPGVRVTIRMPNVRGELAKLVAAISAQGWGILACGGVTVPKQPDTWEAVVKIGNVPGEEVVAALGQVEGQEIVDVREM